MADPLLSSLCRICHINPPKYTCPRCSLQTCSLPCSRRHKVWASCSGIRDPTVYKPKSQVATPSGIDHDYNFLHSIEQKIERSEKEIVEEKGLVQRKELESARLGYEFRRDRPRKQTKGEECIVKRLNEMGTRVDKAPKGMKRNIENLTHWSKNRKCIHWQVEWIREGDAGRALWKMVDIRPLGEAYTELLEEERKESMSAEEKRMETKRKAAAHKERVSKKARLDKQKSLGLMASPVLQDSETTAWNIIAELASNLEALPAEPAPPCSTLKRYHFYLLRPYTPSIFPKILIPLDSSQPLSTLLRNRVVLEFPTIYVLEHSSDEGLPEAYMLEKDFCLATGQRLPPVPLRKESNVSDKEDSDNDDGDATSVSGSEAGPEEGEIV